jgi:N-acetylmuramoyl-L-alanine amidase
LLEKNVVLAVGKELRRALLASGRYDVRMTRTTDVFVALDQRLKASLNTGADLFISLHADSLAESGAAQTIRGATVYTLSERASDEQARLMAEKENASDLVAGLDASEGEAAGEVRNILIDLMKRETANFSADFSNVLVGKLRRTIVLSRGPQRSAAFKVLKQTNSPSVLVELGYLSHREDEKLLSSSAWQKQTAASIAAAIDAYFAKRTVSTP